MYLVILGILLFLAAGLTPWAVNKWLPELGESAWVKVGQGLVIILGLWSIASTSYVNVGDQEVLLLKKHYGFSSLDGEHIIATNGEKGPQAQYMTPGWHPSFLINVLYDTERVPVVHVEKDEYGFLTALDGAPLRPDQYLADQFVDGHEVDMLDAEYFLKHGGQRGPQSSVLPPGNWRINTFLWRVDRAKATDIPIGFVGVVKSNFMGAAGFGNLKASKPDNCSQKTVSTNVQGQATTTDKIDVAADPGKLTATLVPLGCIGVWDKALDPGRYYINDHAYSITQISTRVQTWEFKGGYKKRNIDLTLDQQGTLKQTEWSVDVPVPPGAADKAVIPRIEGWEVPQELRVLAQVTPENAPFVVASVGGLAEIENNVMVPTIRSIVRNVLGAKDRHVMDLADNRSAMEHLVEDSIRPEGLRAGIVIKEVKFGDPALPPELLVSRLRQQLAGQLQDTYRQEKLAQETRITTEQARATADQQKDLVKAQIGVQTAEQDAQAAIKRGAGARGELEQIAAGQAAQAKVLGEDRVLVITLAQEMMKTIKEKPELVSLVGRLVPQTSVTVGSGGDSLGGAAAIFGAMMHAGQNSLPNSKSPGKQ